VRTPPREQTDIEVTTLDGKTFDLSAQVENGSL